MESSINSRITVFCIAAIYVLSLFFFQPWNHGIVKGADPYGYYCYLPSIFIHDDLLSQEKTLAARLQYAKGDYTPASENPLGIDETFVSPTGNQVGKYTVGMAVMLTPFFLIAHFLASLSGDADGFSNMYRYCIDSAGFIYLTLGLILLIPVLRRYFSDAISAAALILIGLATNAFFYATYQPSMSHGTLFFLYSLLIYASMKWHIEPTKKMSIAIGIAAGMITLIRPNEMICLFIPILWQLQSKNAFKEKINLFKTNWKLLALAVCVYIIPGLLQLAYWKLATGQFIFYSYSDETFDFSNPQILNGLISFKNGWFIYTPIMFIAALGCLLSFVKFQTDWLWPLWIILPLHIYISYSWWSWNYINGFGSRPMVELYPLLVLPLGVVILKLSNRKILLSIFGIIAVGFLLLNIFQTYQFSRAVLFTEEMNRAYYISTFGKTSTDINDLLAFDLNELQPTISLNKKHILYSKAMNIEADSSQLYFDSTLQKHVLELTKEIQYSPGLKSTIEDLDLQANTQICVETKALKKTDLNGIYSQPLLVIQIGDHTWKGIRLGNKVGNSKGGLWQGEPYIWTTVTGCITLSQNTTSIDPVSIFIWNQQSSPIYIDSLSVFTLKQ